MFRGQGDAGLPPKRFLGGHQRVHSSARPAGLERLLRYCARPAFASERLRKAGSELIYRCAKPQSEPGSGQREKRSAKGKTGDELHLTLLELIECMASFISSPRTHRHRYFGVLSPNSPHGAAAVALAQVAAVPAAVPICGGQMRIIAFITHSADIRLILKHIGAETEPPRITPARGSPLWDACRGDARQMGDRWATDGRQMCNGVDVGSDWGDAAQTAPVFEVDQRINW